jgi:hypothetical protein
MTGEGTVEITGNLALIEDRAITYPQMSMHPLPEGATSTSMLQAQYPGSAIEPLLNAHGRPVGGGFQNVYLTPAGKSELGGPPSLLKVVNPENARLALHQMGKEATPEELAGYILSASQVDDANYNFLRKIAHEAGEPPAFHLPARKRISPTVVEVERMDAPTLSELKRQNSPLLEKCRPQLDRFVSVIGRVFVGMDQAYRIRYAGPGAFRGVGGVGTNGELRMLPMGPDLNSPNIKLTSDCQVQLIDQ